MTIIKMMWNQLCLQLKPSSLIKSISLVFDMNFGQKLLLSSEFMKSKYSWDFPSIEMFRVFNQLKKGFCSWSIISFDQHGNGYVVAKAFFFKFLESPNYEELKSLIHRLLHLEELKTIGATFSARDLRYLQLSEIENSEMTLSLLYFWKSIQTSINLYRGNRYTILC